MSTHAATAPAPLEPPASRPKPFPPLRKAAVLGAGVMGSRIAAHLANAGLPVVLLDLVSKEGPRSAIASKAIQSVDLGRLRSFFDPAFAVRITPGNFEDHLALLADADWIIECVSENLAIKHALLEKVAPHLHASAVLTTNTSGLSIAAIGAVLPPALQQRFFGTHFFSPPRYLGLIEVIPGPQTSSDALGAITHFADVSLGKECIVVRDTPAFIGNRIGIFVILETIRLMQEQDLSIEEVDALSTSLSGGSGPGVFQIADGIGIDVFTSVASQFPSFAPILPFLNSMVERHWLGEKINQGFYRTVKDAEGKEVREVLNWKTMQYAPAQRVQIPSVDLARNVENMSDRLAHVLAGDPHTDRHARFRWRLLAGLWNHAADCLPEIADEPATVDRVMHTGYFWEAGPFQLWDLAGVPAIVERMRADGLPVSPLAERVLSAGGSWYRNGGRECFHVSSGDYRPVAEPAGYARIATYRASNGVVKRNPGCSLIDLGDGVACLELHSKKCAIGEDIVRLVTETCSPGSESVRNFEAFVIGSDAEHFSVGANILQLLLSSQEGEWDEIGLWVRSVQRMNAAIKFCPRPVVVAPYSFCFGGGAEIAISGARREAHADLFMGFVEASLGLLPAGGGCKEMLLRTLDCVRAVEESASADSPVLAAALRRTFDCVAQSKVSTSAVEARRLGFLLPSDGITMNRGRLINNARQAARDLASRGYSAPLLRTDIPAPGERLLAMLKMAVNTSREGDFISDHDVKIAHRIAHVLCGGNVPPGKFVTEQYFLDLEREAFLSLCGEKKTQERIAHVLKSGGRPLRN